MAGALGSIWKRTGNEKIWLMELGKGLGCVNYSQDSAWGLNGKKAHIFKQPSVVRQIAIPDSNQKRENEMKSMCSEWTSEREGREGREGGGERGIALKNPSLWPPPPPGSTPLVPLYRCGGQIPASGWAGVSQKQPARAAHGPLFCVS